ncbi:MAG TPA: glutamate-5-semialdehyde dehydrogenase [Thermotogota bacterium]|nr:glutamate-5-semialdehyde dehydrogenase [Thermotogota bacterium]HPJ88301.1 glutamate-5-semialdehyde dehydrogenase [Thermotogota bacterium]HPR95352.1 glutamate-5-semialdehyde dehydrogenase [Thermotogota bacterium]
MSEVLMKCRNVKEAEYSLRTMNTRSKNEALLQIGNSLRKNSEEILIENEKDIQSARAKGIRESMIDRLRLTETRMESMITSCEKVAGLDDPVGEVVSSSLENDLRITQVRVPIGAIGMIYESRPNVTLDASILALKAGNPVLLRGGSDAVYSNIAITKAIKAGLRQSTLPETAVEIIEDINRENVMEMMKMKKYLSLIIPRGGASLINFVVENSLIPVIETGVGNCHIYVDEDASVEKSIDIIVNAKTQRPGTCNSVETVLIHEKIKDVILPPLKKRLDEDSVEIRGCRQTAAVIDCTDASEADWGKEFLDYILAIKVVSDVDEAIRHIMRYSTGHSEAILTNDLNHATRFTTAIDSAAVYVNASTRFTDGEMFGFGGEIGISTQKLHARGPVGLKELTSTKYIVLGDYAIRK